MGDLAGGGVVEVAVDLAGHDLPDPLGLRGTGLAAEIGPVPEILEVQSVMPDSAATLASTSRGTAMSRISRGRPPLRSTTVDMRS